VAGVAKEEEAAGGDRGSGSHGERRRWKTGTRRPERVLGFVLNGPGCSLVEVLLDERPSTSGEWPSGETSAFGSKIFPSKNKYGCKI
jgi:hypothetical protein